MAAAARTSLYALKLDTPLFDITSARAPINPFGDRQAQTEGLEMLAGAARGALFTVTGTGAALFERIAVGAVRLLPARRRVRRTRQGRQAAPDPHRRAAQGRHRPIAAAAGERRQRSAGAAHAARGSRGRGLELAADRHGAAGAAGLVRAAGTGDATRCSC